MDMKALGLVFLFDRKLGTPEEMARNFSEHFTMVSENIVLANLVQLVDLKEIMDNNRIYWAGIRENFDIIINDEEIIGKLAWKIFKDNSTLEASDEVKSLIYNSDKVPWNFPLMVCVLYQ
ncbi:MAG: hypothetical protein EU552_00735 [Promethearchaeota archaeon]|nr:MAG: hypothetical protein EU552_00735 [Candidatus Lokiarchaeota archaeon]